MPYPNVLRGAASGALPLETLLQNIGYLAGEIVHVKTGDRVSAEYIIKRWQCNEGIFDIEFCEQALAYLHSVDDPRVDIVSRLFNEIG